MALTTSYLVTVKNIPAFFDSLLSAKAPDTFTQKFIEGLGFKSTNDRLFISLLKGLGFLDANATPTERYFKFLDQSESKHVLAEAIEEAYEDLFSVNRKAYELSSADVKNKLKTLTQGKHSDKVISLMASTFKSLSEYAEWQTDSVAYGKTPKPKVVIHKEDGDATTVEIKQPVTESFDDLPKQKLSNTNTQFHYNIQIHLPESRDESVYDAIFKSLRRHLL